MPANKCSSYEKRRVFRSWRVCKRKRASKGWVTFLSLPSCSNNRIVKFNRQGEYMSAWGPSKSSIRNGELVFRSMLNSLDRYHNISYSRWLYATLSVELCPFIGPERECTVTVRCWSRKLSYSMFQFHHRSTSGADSSKYEAEFRFNLCNSICTEYQ